MCFMNILGQCKKISGFRLYAFVLMSNHVHLLIEPADESLDMIFRRIGTRYAGWYNLEVSGGRFPKEAARPFYEYSAIVARHLAKGEVQ